MALNLCKTERLQMFSMRQNIKNGNSFKTQYIFWDVRKVLTSAWSTHFSLLSGSEYYVIIWMMTQKGNFPSFQDGFMS
jgi:hypothetical protein